MAVDLDETHHGLVAVAGVQLHVDLAVHTSFTLGVIVLTALTESHVVGCKRFW